MAGREVELGEIVVVGLDVGPFGDGEAEVGEDGGDLVEHLADRMDAAGLDPRRAHRQRDVERFRLQPRFERGGLQHRAAGGERLRHLVLQRVDLGPGRAPLVRRHLAERRQQRGDGAFLAERGDAHGFERRLVRRGGDGGEGFGA